MEGSKAPDSENVGGFVERTRARLRPIVEKRALLLAATQVRRGRRRRTSSVPIGCSISEAWGLYVKLIPVDFFTSKEATMNITGRIEKGGTAYRSLVLNESNNTDVARVFDLRVKKNGEAGYRCAAWNNY